MHLVVDARTLTPHFPGIGRYVFNLLQALAPLIAPGERLTAVCGPDTRIPSGIGVATVGGGPFSLQQQWELPCMLRRLRADVYHSPYYLMPYRPGVPTVLTVSDLIPLLHPEHVPLRTRRLFTVLLRLALRAAQRVIAISPTTRHDLNQQLDVPKEQVGVIPLAPDPCFRPQPPGLIARLRSRLGLPHAYVLYLGSNKPHKNLPRLVEAWAHLAGAKEAAGRVLVIAGAWDPRYVQSQERVRQLGLAGRVRFLGPVLEADLPTLYSGAALLVFPSLYEGFGLPVLEAMACGTPVACSRAASLPEVGEDAALYFDPLDVEEIAATMRAVLGDPDRRVSLASASLRQAGRFAWEETARRTLGIYRELAGSGWGGLPIIKS